jgi:hypothetical protein
MTFGTAVHIVLLIALVLLPIGAMIANLEVVALSVGIMASYLLVLFIMLNVI